MCHPRPGVLAVFSQVVWRETTLVCDFGEHGEKGGVPGDVNKLCVREGKAAKVDDLVLVFGEG